MLSTAKSYGFAIVVSFAALALRWLLDPAIGDAFPFITLFGAVAAAVWLGGWRPAILTAVLGYLAVQWFFVEPRGEIAVDRVIIVGLIAYTFTCAVIIAYGEAARLAQRRANENAELLRVTLRSIGDAVITTDNSGHVTYLNEIAENLTGWRIVEARGKPLDVVFRVVSEGTLAPVENPAIRALREGVVVGLANHTLLIRRDDRHFAIDDSAAPIKDESGVVSGCVLIFRDVSAHRAAELEKARQLTAARLLASIIESSDDAIISKNLDGIIQSWNAAAERMFGHSAEDAIGKHISIVIPKDRLAEEDEIISRLRAGKRIHHYETERIRADGKPVQVSLSISPIRNDEGVVVGASKIARDITERKLAEAERQKMLDEVRTLAANLSEADQRKNEFLATLAHELRNPLAPISNAVQVLRRRDVLDMETVESSSELLERQVGQMSRLVDDLIDMSRITSGRIELRKERMDLAVVVRHAVETSRAQYRSLNQELSISLPDGPVMLYADPTRLTQVIGNLLNNAFKFSPRGGHVWLTVRPENGDVSISIRDNGVGMTEEDLPRVFDMFTQLDTTLERSRDGLGIGLTLVRNLVELHRGTITVHSEGRGRGSEFVVRLPRVAPGDAMPETQNGTGTPPAPRRRILIVDDNEDGATSLSMLLNLSGHETFIANDGHEALATFERIRPEIALLDIGLPGINGFDVARRIREMPFGQEATLVAITGWGQENDRTRSRDAGFDAHLVKPVNHEELTKLLSSLPSHASRG